MADNETTFLCPRREESFGGPSWAPSHDEWRGKDPRRTCSWCGAMHPDDFLAAVRAGLTIGPTDKNYKAYVEETLTATQRAELARAYEAQGFLKDHVTELTETAAGEHVGKFYFQHLSEEQRDEFIGMLNAKSVTIGYPGHFYVLPFFISRKAAE